jgi:hypothetical protein
MSKHTLLNNYSFGSFVRKVSVVAIGIQFILLSFPAISSAAVPNFTISPVTTNISQGSSVVMTIQVNTAAPVYAVQACLIYDAAKLQLTNTDYSGDPLGSTTGPAPSTDCSAGEIQLGRYDTTPASGTFTLAKLTFKAVLSSGSTTISFDEARSSIDGTTPSGSNSSTATLKPVPVPDPSPTPASPPATTTTSPAPSKPSSGSTTSPAPAQTTPTPAKLPAITDSGRATPTQATSNDVRQSLDSGATVTKAKTKKKSSLAVVYITIGIIVFLLALGGVILKLLSRRQLVEATFAIPLATTTETTTPISHVPGPAIPKPSDVIQPNNPPSNPGATPPSTP